MNCANSCITSGKQRRSCKQGKYEYYLLLASMVIVHIRVTVLEKRLQEKLQENEELQTQLRRQRDLLVHQQQATQTKKERHAIERRPATAAPTEVPFDILGAEEVYEYTKAILFYQSTGE